MNDNRWFNDKWWVSPFNYIKEIRDGFELPERVYVRDSTIREAIAKTRNLDLTNSRTLYLTPQNTRNI